MANDDDWDDDDPQPNAADNNNNDKAPKGLRAHAKKVEDELKAANARLKELEDAARKDRVTKAVAAKGFDPAVAEVVPADVAADDTALEKWLTAKESLFAKAAKTEDAMVPTGFEEDALDEDADGIMRISQVSAGSLPVTKNADIRHAIASAKTREEMNEIMKKQGNQFVA